MIDPDVIIPFYDYLDPANEDKPWSEMGLVPNAPPEAVEAYKEYQEIEKANAESDNPLLL